MAGPPTGALKPGAATALGTLRHHKAVGSWMNDTQTGVKVVKEGGSSRASDYAGMSEVRGKAFGSRNRSVQVQS